MDPVAPAALVSDPLHHPATLHAAYLRLVGKLTRPLLGVLLGSVLYCVFITLALSSLQLLGITQKF